MLNLKFEMWAGNDASYDHAAKAEAGQLEAMQAFFGQEPKQPADRPYLLNVSGNVGVVSVRGPLVNSSSEMARWFGMTTYSDIRQAMVHAAQDPSIEQIILDVNSGGGAVSGVSDTARLIGFINDKVKPVATFADGVMASGAYWLGAAAGKLYISDTTVAGSIGVITKHVDVSEAMKEAGLKATVLRAGRFKALAQPEEPLSDAARAQIQDSLDAVYEVFLNWVAERRGVSATLADKQMAQGREFVGAEALKAGLVDGITNFDALIASFQKKKVDRTAKFAKNSTQLSSGETAMKVTLENMEALAAAGIEMGAEAGEVAAEAEHDTAEIVAEVAADVAPVEVQAEAPALQALKVEVDLLKGQMKEKNAELLEANLQARNAEAKAAALAEAQSGLSEIVARSVNTMRVALNMPALSAESLNSTDLLAEHGRLSAEYKIQFKIGGVAAAAAEPEAEVSPKMDSARAARLRAVRTNRTK